MLAPDPAIERWHAALAAAGTPERALSEKAYLKSTLVHLGSGQPAVRAVSRQVDAELPKTLAADALMALVFALHGSGVHELRALAIALLERRQRRLGPESLPQLESLCRRCPGWAYIDWLATKVVDPVCARLPSEREAECLRTWAADPDFWLRRVALLVPLTRLRRGGGDFALWASLAVPMLGEREFFIRKALGWVLREVSKKRPELVRAFVAAHGAQMSGLTRREATKYLPAD